MMNPLCYISPSFQTVSLGSLLKVRLLHKPGFTLPFNYICEKRWQEPEVRSEVQCGSGHTPSLRWKELEIALSLAW